MWEIQNIVNNVRYEVKGITSEGKDIVIIVNAINNTNSSLTLDYFNGTLLAGNTPLARIQSNQPILLSPHSITEVVLRVRIDTVGVIEEIIELITGTARGGLRLVGTTAISGIVLPVNIVY
jgi:LEA14-like dessication related protein